MHPLADGFELKEYQLQHVLGRGGFGTTYLAIDKNLGSEVAIKEFTPPIGLFRSSTGRLDVSFADDVMKFQAMKADFLTEARNLARFRHPNIVRVVRYFEANNTAYLVMENEPGQTLRSLIRSRTSQPSEDEVLAVIGPICDGLRQMHVAGLIHRDIKPENIIIRKDNVPCLIDFGAAILFDKVDIGEAVKVVVTDGYSPPEQFNPNRSQGPWTDIYALGATAYDFMFGITPPPARERIVYDEMTPAAHLSAEAGFSTRLALLVDRCLSLEISDRPSSISEFTNLLSSTDHGPLRHDLSSISAKMTQHFLNWATPNSDLMSDELAMFMAIFPVIDLSWRIGEGASPRSTLLRLGDLAEGQWPTLARCHSDLVRAGFASVRDPLSFDRALSRLDAYGSAYLLDRQEESWTFELTKAQLVRNCLVGASERDRIGFPSMMEDIVDRGRGRVKKAYQKYFDRS